MISFNLGQEVDIDICGLPLGGAHSASGEASGRIVALAPGAITVRLELDGRASEVTISPGRICR